MTAYAVSDVVHVANVVQVTGSFVSQQARASSAITTVFTASQTSQQFAANNSSRLGITVNSEYSTFAGYLYLSLGVPATTSSYVTALWPGSYWEAPYGYTGAIYGLFVTTEGGCTVTEFF